MKNLLFMGIIVNSFCIVLYASHNPLIPRVDTLTAEVEHGKAQSCLLQTAARKTHTDSKIKMLVETHRNYEQAKELERQDAYNQAMLRAHQSLNQIIDRKTLRSIGVSLSLILDKHETTDQEIATQLNQMYKNIENKYCFKKPSLARIERERQALYELVNKRLQQIHDQNIQDDEDDGGSTPTTPPSSAPIQAVAHYQGWI